MTPIYLSKWTRLIHQDPKTSDCVPCALATVLLTFGLVTNLDEILATLKVALGTTESGTDLRKIRGALEHFPVDVKRIPFSPKAIAKVIKRGGLVLAAYDSAPGEGHVTVISGYERSSDGLEYYELADPLYGRLTIPVKMLEANAKISGFWCRSIERKESWK